jgi:hypothetical protein
LSANAGGNSIVFGGNEPVKIKSLIILVFIASDVAFEEPRPVPCFQISDSSANPGDALMLGPVNDAKDFVGAVRKSIFQKIVEFLCLRHCLVGLVKKGVSAAWRGRISSVSY